MNLNLINEVWQMATLSTTQKLILLAISHVADKMGISRELSVVQLAQQCSLSEHTIHRGLKHLEAHGYLSRADEEAHAYHIHLEKPPEPNTTLNPQETPTGESV